MEQILSTINVLCNTFQEKTATLGKASKIIHGVIQTFEHMRTSDYFSKVWQLVEEFVKKHNISIRIPSQALSIFIILFNYLCIILLIL